MAVGTKCGLDLTGSEDDDTWMKFCCLSATSRQVRHDVTLALYRFNSFDIVCVQSFRAAYTRPLSTYDQMAVGRPSIGNALIPMPDRVIENMRLFTIQAERVTNYELADPNEVACCICDLRVERKESGTVVTRASEPRLTQHVDGWLPNLPNLPFSDEDQYFTDKFTVETPHFVKKLLDDKPMTLPAFREVIVTIVTMNQHPDDRVNLTWTLLFQGPGTWLRRDDVWTFLASAS